MKLAFRPILALLVLTLFGCDRTDSAQNQRELEEVVRTTSAPIDALTRRIVGDAVPVELLCPASEDPSKWMPDAETVARYQRTKLIVSNGAGYENWVRTAPLPRTRVIEAADAIADSFIAVKGETHSHGPDGSHSHEVTLSHVWLDPLHAISQARAINAGLIEAFPEHEAAFNDRLSSLSVELNELHRRLEKIDHPTIEIIAPSIPFGYLTQRYAWQTPDLSSDPRNWSTDLYKLRLESGDLESSPTIILCDALPDPRIADALIESHRAHVILWKTGAQDAGASFTDLLSDNIERLETLVLEMTP